MHQAAQAEESCQRALHRVATASPQRLVASVAVAMTQAGLQVRLVAVRVRVAMRVAMRVAVLAVGGRLVHAAGAAAGHAGWLR